MQELCVCGVARCCGIDSQVTACRKCLVGIMARFGKYFCGGFFIFYFLIVIKCAWSDLK
jgi:hypothetical protein